MKASDSKVTRDMQRIMKIDAEIIDLRYLLLREQQRELELGKHTLLLSRGIKYKLEKLIRARNALAKLTKNKPSQRATYQVELASRKDTLDEAYERMRQLDASMKNLAHDMLLNPSEQKNLDFKVLMKEIKSQRTAISNKERAVENWVNKGEMVPERVTRNRLPKDYSVARDVEEILAENSTTTLKGDSISPVTNPLESDPRWNVNPFHNTGLDELLNRAAVNDGGWGNPNADYEPPPQVTKITI